MTSDFMKQHRAERIAASQFKPGALVALVNHHWGRRIERKATVMKVHANGNFTICNRDGTTNTRQWVPDYQGTSARPTGKATGFHHEHLEIWTSAIDAEIVERAAKRDRATRVATIRGMLESQDPAEHTLLAIEAALGLSTAATSEPEAD